MNIFGRIKGAPYATVAALMKRNFVGLGKKYDSPEVWELVNKINKAIDEHDTDYTNLSKQLRVTMIAMDNERKQKGHKFICIEPGCNNPADIVRITDKEHIVFCKEHYDVYLKLKKLKRKQVKG